LTTREQIALVTGGNKGIGRAVAAELAGQGMTVLLGAREGMRGRNAAANLRVGGHRVDAVGLDVTDAASIAEVASYVATRFGKRDILVNNAGIAGDMAAQRPGAAALAVARAVFATNVFGVIGLTDAMVGLLRRSTAGRVVNVSSGLGSLARMTDSGDSFTRLPPSAAYAPSKTALNGAIRQGISRRRHPGELRGPGPCATDFTHGIPGVTPTAADGAAVIVRPATLGADGPTGRYFNTVARWRGEPLSARSTVRPVARTPP
jgi:NAD(P)-dependent dehydrogenase (short-subunit alcohol dehydrogenase family)